MKSPSQVIQYFSKTLAAEQILTTPSELEFYGKDVSKQFKAAPSCILLPKSVEEVSSVLKICSQHKIAVVPSGGRTGYSGGATAQNGEIILSLSKMNRILEINLADSTLTCEAGVTTEAVINAAREKGLFYPVDFTSKGSSQIGGNISTNAGGIRVVRYGNTREWVLGLKVVLASGEVLNLNGHLWKNQTGYDLRHLIIGSEGTLAVVVEATLKLTSLPKDSTLVLAGAKNSEVALEILSRLRRSGFEVNVFEYFERACLEMVVKHTQCRDPFTNKFEHYFLIEIESPSTEVRAKYEEFLEKLSGDGLVQDIVVPEGEKQRKDIMALRELIGEVANKHYVPHKNDISVPVPMIPRFLSELQGIISKEFPSWRTLTFGHVGDGNLHVNVIKPEAMESAQFFKECEKFDEVLFCKVAEFKGSISAEHGVGLLKREHLHLSRQISEVEIMKSIKAAFDPLGVLNPGKIFKLN